MSIKGSWTRVKDAEGYERNKERIYMRTDALLTSLGDRLRALGAPAPVVDGYRQALALRSAIVLDRPSDEKEGRRLILDLHKQLDELEDTR